MIARAPAVKMNARAKVDSRGFAVLSRQCACGQHTVARGKCEDCNEKTHSLQRRSRDPAQPGIAPPIVHEVLRSPGRPLDSLARAAFEPRFGHDFSAVRIHADAAASASARAVNASAYTVGQNIVFAENRYAPATAVGARLLAHELAHTVQQHGAASPEWGTLKIGDPADMREREADQAAAAALSGHPAKPHSPSPLGLQRQHHADEPPKDKDDLDEDAKFRRWALSRFIQPKRPLFDTGGINAATTGPNQIAQPPSFTNFAQGVRRLFGSGSSGANLLGSGGRGFSLAPTATNKTGNDVDEKTKAQQQAQIERQLLSYYIQPRRRLFGPKGIGETNVPGTGSEGIASVPTSGNFAQRVRSGFAHPDVDEKSKFPSPEDFRRQFLALSSDSTLESVPSQGKDEDPEIKTAVVVDPKTKSEPGSNRVSRTVENTVEATWKAKSGFFKKAGSEASLTLHLGPNGFEELEADIKVLKKELLRDLTTFPSIDIAGETLPNPTTSPININLLGGTVRDPTFSLSVNPGVNLDKSTAAKLIGDLSAKLKASLEADFSIPKTSIKIPIEVSGSYDVYQGKLDWDITFKYEFGGKH